MRGTSSSKRAILVLILVLLFVFVAYDLTSQDSLLVSFWNSLTNGPGQGERFRDDLLRGLGKGR